MSGNSHIQFQGAVLSVARLEDKRRTSLAPGTCSTMEMAVSQSDTAPPLPPTKPHNSVIFAFVWILN